MSDYTVHMTRQAWAEMKRLPGNMRQRVKRAVDGFRDDPRPSGSKELDVSQMPQIEFELRRLRLDRWRIVYAVTEADKLVDVLTVRRRPPYDYGDLRGLIAELT